MNMISTAFPIETDASNKIEPLAKKFASVWEKKNSKAARAGGISLMALTLAACGAEDDTPFSQDDIDAATAPLTASVTAAQTQAATALVAQAAAEQTAASATVSAATALVAKAAAESQAATALVAQAAAEQAAATATVSAAAATAATAVAEAATVVAEAALATAQASLATETAAKVVAEGALSTAQASLTTVQAQYDALIAPVSLVLTNSAVPDVLTGGVGSDTFTAAAGTITTNDSVRDNTRTDADVFNITHTAAGPLPVITIQNVEIVNMSINNLAAGAYNIAAQNYSGIDNLVITRGDVVVGGSTLTGSKNVDVINISGGAAGIAKITTAGTTGNVLVTQNLTAGMTLDADNATGNITATGAGTYNAAGAGAGDTVTVTAITVGNAGSAAAEAVANALPVTVNTNAATVTIANNTSVFDGIITVAAPAASVVTIANATGGATVNALGGTTSGDITVTGIDASGATVVTTLNQAASATAQDIDLSAVAAVGTNVYTASVSALGNVGLDTGKATNAVDVVTLAGNGGAVNYTVVSTQLGTTTFNADSNVTITGDDALFSANTVGAAASLNLTGGGGVAIDASKWTPTKVSIGFDNTDTAAITAAAGQSYEYTVVQTGIDFNFGALVVDQDLTITAGDINPASDPTVGTLTVQGLDVTSGTPTSGTVTIIANESNLTATSVTAAALQDIVITGDENVTLGTVATSNSINSVGSTGNLSATLGVASKAVSSGSGSDTLVLNGGRVHTVDAGSGDDNITATVTSDTTTIAGGLGDDTITLTSTNQIVATGGDGADNFITGVATGATIVGGAGSDTLTLNGAGVTLAAPFAVAGVENLNISATNGTTTMTAAQFSGLASAKITGNTANDALVINAAAGGATLDMSNLTATTGSTQTITTVMGAGNDVITGSVLAETFAFNGASGWLGTDSIAGGGTGIDTITTNDTTVTEVGSGNASTGVVVNLGATAVSNVNVLLNASGHLAGTSTAVAAGTIQYMYAAADTTNVNSATTDTVSGIENYTSTNGINYVVGSSSANTITLGAGADYVDGGAGNDIITGAAGIDKLLGGIGNDSFVYTVTADLVAGSAVVDTITGGTGTADAIVINNNGGATFTIAASDILTRLTTVETIKAGAATDQIVTITLEANATAVSGLNTVDLSLDTDSTSNNVIDVDLVTGAGNGFTLIGSAGVDTITGTDFADTITGGADADIIDGGTGIDRIKFSDTNGQAAITFVRNSDLLDFSGVTAQGTIAEVAITNDAGTALGATTLTSNTTVYYIDTDATELGSATTTTPVSFSAAAFATWLNLDDGFVAGGVAGDTNYIVINDASITTAGYVFKHTDDGDATLTIETGELSLIAVTAHNAGALDINDGVIA